MTMKLLTVTEKLSDGSEVFDVYLYDDQGLSRAEIAFHACSAADALALQGGLVRLIKAHTVEEVREC
jgi:hypothetical protein